jgi:transaldolase
MEIFLDTANLDDIQKYHALGILDGVTTNPALIAREGQRDVRDVIVQICELVHGPVSVEVVSQVAEGMVDEALKLSAVHKHVVVKIPATFEGFKALHHIRRHNLEHSEQVKTNFTVLYTANQALLAAKLGATYVSPFIGRLDINSTGGPELIREIRQIYDNFGFKTKILAASMRTAVLVKQAALAGSDVATIPVNTLDDMISNELSKNALKGFLDSWNEHYEGKTMLGDEVV